VNLFKVDEHLWSHPEKPYAHHIQNISDSFDDEAHKIAANFHDIGKLSNEFQCYIRKETKKKTTHAIEGGYLFPFLVDEINENFLPIFFSVVKHHLSLSNIKEDVYKYSNEYENNFDKESWIDKISVIEKNLGLDSEHSAETFHNFFKMFYDNFANFSNMDTFFAFKQRYSRLILVDKFEAIFNKPYINIPILSDDKISKHLTKIESIISQKQKERPNEYRTKARETIFSNFENSDSNIYLIKAPTGVGKTFIALELALKIAKKKGDKRRIITAIPFTSIIDQTHSEYEQILEGERVLKYHHLTKYKKDDEDEKEQFSQKVFLTDIWHEHFIVTTFNQLLYTLFSNHNRDNVRLETLRDSVIIVDEVQNLPRTLFPSVVKVFDMFTKQYNMHFIIMSATMPSFNGLVGSAKILSEDWFYQEKQNRYRLHYISEIKGFDTLAYKIEQHSKSSVLCVVNTIEKAKKLFNQLESEHKFLLTTHQIPKHRKEIIKEIKEALENNISIKLVATQLIEAGVDLDFDIGYREFAPFGSIVQMAGRVNREGKKGVADVYIFDYLELENGNEKLKKLPYHAIDLQEDTIREWLKKPLEETAILENLDTYFESIKEQTSTVELEQYMKNLEFQTLFEKLNENFMPKQPWKVSLFIEDHYNHFNDFIEKRQSTFDNCEDKFDAINRVNELEKDLGLYTISVNEKLIAKLTVNPRFLFGRYILSNDNIHYSKEKGFSAELTRVEENVFD
jgi:CRISPR-associated endonuclease/helicase Cas3